MKLLKMHRRINHLRRSSVNPLDFCRDVIRDGDELIHSSCASQIPAPKIRTAQSQTGAGDERRSAAKIRIAHVPNVTHRRIDISDVKRPMGKYSLGNAVTAGKNEI